MNDMLKYLKYSLLAIGLLGLAACSPWSFKNKVDIGQIVSESNVNIGGFCSGTVLNSGHILTADHCVPYINDKTIVSLEEYDDQGNLIAKRIFKVKVLREDKKNDSALLEAPGITFKVNHKFAKKIHAGERLYCVGMPMGEPRQGYISDGLFAKWTKEIKDQKMLMITCPVYGGMSGGAVYNEQGEQVGIVDAGRVAWFLDNNMQRAPINLVGLSYANSIWELTELLKGET